MVVIATANNPKNLVAAVLERPGRFDRVVAFPNPTPDLAVRYLLKLNPSFEADELNKISFPGMSYAQIRELYILAWQAAEERGSEEATAQDLMVAMKRMQGMLEVKTRPVGLR
jgi:ATP-dependent 26S proteasome regulatory subunit